MEARWRGSGHWLLPASVDTSYGGHRTATSKKFPVSCGPSFAKADTAQAPTRHRILDHIGFDVKDHAAFVKKLEADGIKLDEPPRQATPASNKMRGIALASVLGRSSARPRKAGVVTKPGQRPLTSMIRACSTPKPASLRAVLNSTAVSCCGGCGSFVFSPPEVLEPI
jgi:hypothetical protein